DLGWTSTPTTSMSGDSSYTGTGLQFYDSPGESPSYASLLAHTLFSRQSIPACLSTCLANADLGGCVATDNACLCKSQVFVTGVATCVYQACTGADLTAAFNDAEQLCLAVGVTLSAVPPGSTTTTGASSPATTSGRSSSTSSNGANRKSTVMVGPIVGGVVGFLALVFFVVGLIWFWKSRRKRVRWSTSPPSAEHSPILPSSIVEPFRIPSAAPQNSGQLQSSNKPISSGELPASPSLKQVEATRGLSPTTTQTPSPIQQSSSSASTPIGGLYSDAMVGSGSRMVLHQDSGIRLPRQAGEDGVVVEMPPLYTPS
ncbi:hypothetical protein K443DRAFT_112214, partial [Laccaria amethystina LaAM-08-1]